MKTKSLLKLPNQLNLGTILPGQYGQIVLPFQNSVASFLTLELSKKSINAGYFLLKEGTNDCTHQLNIVVKPAVTLNVIIASYPCEVTKATTFNGQLFVAQEQNVHTIKLIYKVQLPKILCKKMLENIKNQQKMIRIIINKAVTNEGRIMLTNMEEYGLELKVGLLARNTINDKDNPFLLKIGNPSINVQPREQFTIFITLTTNIGFKNEFKGMKKCVLRNVIAIKTNSILLWCLPIQIFVIFVKQPQMKE